MLSYFLKSKKNIESKNPNVARTNNGRIWCFYQIVQCVMVKNFIEQQEASGLLSSLGIKAPLSKVPLVGPLLF